MADDAEAPTLTFHVGDTNLRLLGAAAVLAARHQFFRKAGLPHFAQPGAPTSAADALELLRQGMEVGMRIPLDDVPDLHIGIYADESVIRDLLDTTV